MAIAIPKVALELGIRFREYEELARNIKNIDKLSQKERDNLVERANKELDSETLTKCKRLIEYMEYDRKVYLIAGLKYHNGPPEGKNLFSSAVVDYILRNKKI